jgi:hypothetical protein
VILPTAGASSEQVPGDGGFLVPNPELARQKYADAGEAFGRGEYDLTLELLDEAVKNDPSMEPDVNQAKLAVENARA